MISCPKCRSPDLRKNGKVDGGQRFVCRSCKYQFVCTLGPKPAKSGVIPLPCREREFRELRRDPFAHMRLALEVRR